MDRRLSFANRGMSSDAQRNLEGGKSPRGNLRCEICGGESAGGEICAGNPGRARRVAQKNETFRRGEGRFQLENFVGPVIVGARTDVVR